MTNTIDRPDEDPKSRDEARHQGYEDIQGATAGLDGVLSLLDQHSAQSEVCYSAYCLIDTLKERLQRGLRKVMLAS